MLIDDVQLDMFSCGILLVSRQDQQQRHGLVSVKCKYFHAGGL